MEIVEAKVEDWPRIWPIFHEVVAAGDSYPYRPDTSFEQGQQLWLEYPEATFMAVENSNVVGTYYLKPNQPGLGSHICNCGYMVASSARGQGVATFMCQHSQEMARQRGYRAMQFNLVVASNTKAVRLWRHLGYEVIGEVPAAFSAPDGGYHDALIMYKSLL